MIIEKKKIIHVTSKFNQSFSVKKPSVKQQVILNKKWPPKKWKNKNSNFETKKWQFFFHYATKTEMGTEKIR